MEKIVVVIKNGMVQNVYAQHPSKYDVEIIDLDLENESPEMVDIAEERLQSVESNLCKIY